MQGFYAGAFHGEKRDILALLTKLGEDRAGSFEAKTIYQFIFSNMLLPDNWAEIPDDAWTKVFYGSGGTMTITSIGDMTFDEVSDYCYPLEWILMTSSFYGGVREYSYSGYLSSTVVEFDSKASLNDLAKEYEKLMRHPSIANDKLDWYCGFTEEIANIIPRDVIPAREKEEPAFAVDISAVLDKIRDKQEAKRIKQEEKRAAEWLERPLFEISEAGVMAAYYGDDEAVVIPDEVTVIDDFCGYSSKYRQSYGMNTKSVMVGKNVREIKEHSGNIPFAYCKSLSEIIVDEDNESFSSNDGILYDRKMTKMLFCPIAKRGKIVIPNSVKMIKKSAFSIEFEDSYVFTDIVIPKGVKKLHPFLSSYGANIEWVENWTLRSNSFSGNIREKTLIVADGVKRIEEWFGDWYRKPDDVVIPDSVIEIGRNAFQYFGMKSLSIPDSVLRIESGAFSRCLILKRVEVSEHCEVSDSAFEKSTQIIRRKAV